MALTGLARLIGLVVALHERLRIRRQIGLRLASSEGLLGEGLRLLLALLEILVLTRLELLVVAGLGARLEVRVVLPELLLRGSDQAEIVLGMLEIVFGRDRIAGGLGVTRQLQIFLRHVIGRSADLHVGAVRFIHPRQRVVTAAVVIVVVVIVAPAHALVVMMLLTVSHGSLFNNSRLRRIRQSLPNPAGKGPASNFRYAVATHPRGYPPFTAEKPD
jgi:hypothetical protein